MPDRRLIMFKGEPTPEQLAELELQRMHALRNQKWFADHATEIIERYAGQVVCIAGGELFVAATIREAEDKATAAHPEDRSPFTPQLPWMPEPFWIRRLRALKLLRGSSPRPFVLELELESPSGD